MIKRFLSRQLSSAIARSPAVALLGPRQVGKTTLALEIGQRCRALYLDLESEQDRAKLAQPELYLTDHQDKLVILDEVHRAPGLFPVLRGLIDQGRRVGRTSGQYLLLGSASLDLLKQSGETLAGRIAADAVKQMPQIWPQMNNQVSIMLLGYVLAITVTLFPAHVLLSRYGGQRLRLKSPQVLLVRLVLAVIIFQSLRAHG